MRLPLGRLLAKRRPTRLSLVLLLRDDEITRELGLMLWIALREAARFWKEALDVSTRRFLATPVRLSGLDRSRRDDERVIRPGTIPDSAWAGPYGRYTLRYEPEDIERIVRRYVVRTGDAVVVVTDRELAPPEDWRYMIWDWDEGARYAVISIAPLDPEYWGVRDKERLQDLKHRVRTAAINAAAPLLGVKWCTRRACLLNEAVTGVGSLDAMIALEPGHDRLRAAGKGFKRRGQVAVEQPLVALESEPQQEMLDG
jgi:hypothetical protein